MRSRSSRSSPRRRAPSRPARTAQLERREARERARETVKSSTLSSHASAPNRPRRSASRRCSRARSRPHVRLLRRPPDRAPAHDQTRSNATAGQLPEPFRVRERRTGRGAPARRSSARAAGDRTDALPDVSDQRGDDAEADPEVDPDDHRDRVLEEVCHSAVCATSPPANATIEHAARAGRETAGRAAQRRIDVEPRAAARACRPRPRAPRPARDGERPRHPPARTARSGAGTCTRSGPLEEQPGHARTVARTRGGGDHHALHLVRALADLEDLLVAVEPRDRRTPP